MIKKYSIKDKISINISFMHYMKSARVMLPVMFGEFEIVYIFLLLFSFHSLFIWLKANFRKNLVGCSHPASLFLRLVNHSEF